MNYSAPRGGQIDRPVFTRFVVLAFLVSLLVAAFGAADAKAAFEFTGADLGVTSTQAGGHPEITLDASVDAVSADQSGDDLRDLAIDLPAGVNLNPQSVATPCGYSSFASDKCPAATQVGSVSVRFRVGSSSNTANGSVYMLVPDNASVLKLGFVVRPNNFQKLIFSSANVTGLGTVRSGLHGDYGLSIRVASIPRTIKTWYGAQVGSTISDIEVKLASRSGSTGTGPYFVYNSTSCSLAETRIGVTSYRGESLSRNSSFTPTGCEAVDLDPSITVVPHNTNAGEPTRVVATLKVPTAEREIQQSQIREVSVNLPRGMTLNMSALNAIPALCSEEQLDAASCPIGATIGYVSISVPFLPSTMSGQIYLLDRSDGVQFGVVARGARGTLAIFRGVSVPDDFGGPTIRTTFTDLPQVPFSSATLDFAAQLVNNPKDYCSGVVWADITGYSSSRSIIGLDYPVTNCIELPETTIDARVGALTRDTTPGFSFSSNIAAATFECSLDDEDFTACAAPFTTSPLSQGDHTFSVRAVNSGKPDRSPATASFKIDSVPPSLSIESPSDGSTVTSNSLSLSFSAEPGAVVYCWLDDGTIRTCASPVAYSDLADGEHRVSVFARDAAGNLAFVEHYFNVLLQQPPVVEIHSPVNGAQAPLDEFTLDVTASSPAGTAITGLYCTVSIPEFSFVVIEKACEDGEKFSGFSSGTSYLLTVTATDADGLEGEATARYIAGIRRPNPVRVNPAPSAQRLTDRTPTFTLVYGDPLYPEASFECSLVTSGSAPDFKPCGNADQLDPYEVTAPLANGKYTFTSRTFASGFTSQEARFSFTVADWDVEYSATVSTQQAGAHPDLDVSIEPSAGQLRSMDMRLPVGMFGSLTAFPQCALEHVETAACPIESKIGEINTDIRVNGLAFSVSTVGTAFLTEPQVEGDVAGMTLLVETPIAPFSDVVIPLRIQTVNNVHQMRVFSDTIPTTTYNTAEETFDDFYVVDFDLHLNGSQGSPYPLLTNPTSCQPDAFATSFGDTELLKTEVLSSEFTSTGCDSLVFGPSLDQQFSSLQAGTTTDLHAELTVPSGSKGLHSIRVEEPTAIAVNNPSFGSPSDQCPSAAAESEELVFDHRLCPEQAKIGTMTIETPLFPTPITGDVYLIEKSPIPWFGARLNAPGISLALVGVTSTPKVNPSCNPVFTPGGCRTRVAIDFVDLPDVPFSRVELKLDKFGRISENGTPLGSLLRVTSPSDPGCVSPAAATMTAAPHDGGDPVVASQQFAFVGCT